MRLGVMGGSDDERRDLARRIHRADVDLDATESACDAVALLAPEDGDVERLIAAGKHVLVAGEIDLSVERLDAWAMLARAGGLRLAVPNRERHLPSRQLIRQQLDGPLGRPGLVRVHRWPAFQPALLLADLDVALWLMGVSPDVVCALEGDGGVLQVHLGFPGGGMALISHASAGLSGHRCSSLSVIASAGAAYADDQANRQLFFTRGEPCAAFLASEEARAVTSMVQSFVDDVLNGADSSPALAAWGRAVAVRDAVTRSLATRRAVRLEGA